MKTAIQGTLKHQKTTTMNGYDIFALVMTVALVASAIFGFKPIWDDLGKNKKDKY